MRRDNFDGKDYFKLALDCVYYAWQHEEITNIELGETEKELNRMRKVCTNSMSGTETIIAAKFSDFTTKFIDKICKQILENQSEGRRFWIADYQVKEITKQILKEIKGDEEC